MSVAISRYNEIIKEYDRKRLKLFHDKDAKQKEIYSKVPRIKEIDDTIASLSVSTAKDLLLSPNASSTNPLSNMRKQIATLKQEKESLISSNFPKGFLDPVYECNDCRDTGFLGNSRCHCFKKQIIDALYEQSNLKEILALENFEHFDISLFSNTQTDSSTGLTPIDNMYRNLEIANDFVNNFGTNFSNLFIYGATGVGKTFLTNCIAKKLMDSSYSVAYLSSIRLFEILADVTFGRGDTDAQLQYSNIYDCDLLIIDDLGTEVNNNFTSSRLFDCINERFLNRKPVIISTNLALSDLRDTYSERIFSRITSNYTLMKIFGDDLRVKKALS